MGTFWFYPLWDIDTNIWALNADNGIGWFDEDDAVKINTSNKVESLQWILDWQDHYGAGNINEHEAEFGSGVSDPFISELVAIQGNNINYYLDIKENAPEDFNFGVAPLPEFEKDGGHYTWGGGFVLEAPEGAKHPEESYEFMKYLTEMEAQESFGLSSFDIMANEEANLKLIENDELDKKEQMIFELADDNFDYTVLTPTPLEAPDFDELIQTEIDEALLGNKTAEEALEDAEKSVKKLMKENNGGDSDEK